MYAYFKEVDSPMTHATEQRYWHVFVGSYSPEDRPGIRTLLFDSREGSLTQLHAQSGIENPSFLAVHPKRPVLYAVSETGDNGRVVAYAIDPHSGSLTELNSQPTEGAAACHVSLDPTGQWLSLVNYTGGSVCLYPIQADGTVGPLSDRVQHTGHSVRPDRQEGPHPHSIVTEPSGRFQLVPDLGTDRIYVYRIDQAHGKYELQREIPAAPGTGPRHIAFHPLAPWVYIIEELSSTITFYELDAGEGRLTAVQTAAALPEDFAGESIAADIHIDPAGRYLYGSNRGHDSIAVFRIAEDGTLAPLGHVPTEGRTPRNFAITPDGGYLLTANQDTDNLVVMRLSDDGMPIPSGEQLQLEKPVCVIVTAAPDQRSGSR